MKTFKKLLALGSTLLLISQPSLSAENTPNIEFGGRIQADNTDFRNDKYSYTDGSELRRARVFVRGDLNQSWDYKVQFDFAPENTELKDAYLRYNGFANSRISIGNFKQFTSLEQIISSNNITFAERALPNALVTDRRMGIGFQTGATATASPVSAYGHEANNRVRGKGYGGRFVYRPSLGGEHCFTWDWR